MSSLGTMKREDTLFVMIDIQEKFLPVIKGIDQVIKNANIIVKASQIFDIPLIVTEQYPKGLGATTERISLPTQGYKKIEKNYFSCFDSEDFISQLKQYDRNTLVLFGIETHICLLQTSLYGKKRGYEIHTIADAMSSRTLENKQIALERMRQSNIFVASTEMVLYQLLKKAGTEEFKQIYKLIK